MQLDRSVADRKFAAENWSINWKLARVGMEYCTRTWFVFWLKDSKGKVFGAVRMPNLLQPKFSKNIWRGDGIRCNPKQIFSIGGFLLMKHVQLKFLIVWKVLYVYRYLSIEQEFFSMTPKCILPPGLQNFDMYFLVKVRANDTAES